VANLSELVNEIWDYDAGGIRITGAILGTLADISGAVGFLQIGVGLITSFFSSDNQLQQALAIIQKDFNELTRFIAAEDKLARMRDIDAGINPALAVFQQLPAILDGPPLSREYILSKIETCLGAALFFAENDDKWKVVWKSIPYYSDKWSGQLAPAADGDGLVFNYTYTLPQFLRAIYILLTTIGALAPKTLADYRSPLERCLTRLSTVHDTIVSSGIVGTRVPIGSDIGWVVVPDPPDKPYWVSNWWVSDQLAMPYGAVERYSGASLVVSYYNRVFVYIDMDPTYAPTFIRLVQLRIAQQKKALYSQLGLPAVREAINHLRSLIGQPPLADPHYEDWSVKEALGIMQVPAPASGRSLLSVIKGTPPFAGWWYLQPDPNDPTVFDAWMPGRPLPAGLRGLLTGG
jgi:hypothetical protein